MRRLMSLVLLVGCESTEVGGTTVDAAIYDTLPPCEGTCKTTSLTATFMATRTLDVAYFGNNSDFTLYVEAYKGAAAGCPTMNSPSPEYTLILGQIGAQGTSPASFIDFKGDMLPSVQPVTATSVTLTPVAADTDFAAFDVMLTFAAGTVSGHFYATHCDSLDN
jgi:hypothetical protein